jgi:hypothetical protein
MTKEEDIFFRASSFGNLMVDDKDVKISDSQLLEISDLEIERDTLKNKNGNAIKWTSVKNQKLEYLISKRDAPPKLSKSAKKEVEKIWRMNEKDFYKDFDSKYTDKGIFNEQDGILLLNEVWNRFFIKNDVRKHKNNLTGECDVIDVVDGMKTVLDIKCSWDLETQMNNDLSLLYEFQLRVYMYLYDAEQAYLVYCLTDCPAHLIEAEKKKIFWKYFSPDMDADEQSEMELMILPMQEQIERNLIYSTNPKYKKEERIKTFKITRDLEIEEKMLSKIKPALDYYKTITLK